MSNLSVTRYDASNPRGALLVLAHGAGAGQRHPFMTAVARGLAERGVDVVTFDFPYMHAKRRMPDKAPVLEESFRAVIAAARADLLVPPEAGKVGPYKDAADVAAGVWADLKVGPYKDASGVGADLQAGPVSVAAGLQAGPDRRLFIGGKSMGGRMATHLGAQGLEGLRGIVALGYPLHPPGRPDQPRTAHLPSIEVPVMIVQGERDTFGTPSELAPVIATMRAPVTLHVVAGGDHSLGVRGRTPDDTRAPVLDAIAEWIYSV